MTNIWFFQMGLLHLRHHQHVECFFTTLTSFDIFPRKVYRPYSLLGTTSLPYINPLTNHYIFQDKVIVGAHKLSIPIPIVDSLAFIPFHLCCSLFLVLLLEEKEGILGLISSLLQILFFRHRREQMAKKIMLVKSWMEVAPSPVVLPLKPSHCPNLETIKEDRAEGRDDNDNGSWIWPGPNMSALLFLDSTPPPLLLSLWECVCVGNLEIRSDHGKDSLLLPLSNVG